MSCRSKDDLDDGIKKGRHPAEPEMEVVADGGEESVDAVAVAGLIEGMAIQWVAVQRPLQKGPISCPPAAPTGDPWR